MLRAPLAIAAVAGILVFGLGAFAPAARSDDAALPTISIDDVTLVEGSGEGMTPASFTVTLSAASESTVTVDFETTDGTANGIVPDRDPDYFTRSGTITFAPGETSQTIDVDVFGDNVDEADESFSVTLTNAAGATILDGEGVATIVDDEEDAAVDVTPPAIECAAPDGAWHAQDVTLQCTATDAESGLADPADSSFALSTSVAAGTETAGAETNSRLVCDNAGNCATAGPIGGIMVDKKAPSITSSLDLLPNAAGWNRGNVTVTFAGTDAGSGVASITGPVVVSTEGAGQHVTGTVVDNAGNQATLTATVNIDKTAPRLVLPGTKSENATSSVGAFVNYTVSATDTLDPTPFVSCTPASGGTFAIGDTIVRCSATDAAGNTSQGTFTVHVKGAKEQLKDFFLGIVNDSKLSPMAKAMLSARIQSLISGFDPSRKSERRAACAILSGLGHLLEARPSLWVPPDKAARLAADSERIMTVLGC
jgi:Calx-beta domain-containing protein/HYR domain-containing protein